MGSKNTTLLEVMLKKSVAKVNGKPQPIVAAMDQPNEAELLG